MNWYYLEGGNRLGPHSGEAFRQLVERGAVRPETLVWHDGLPNWVAYGQVAAVAPAAPVAVAVAAAPADGTSFCSECGRRLPADQLVRFGTHSVCGACKDNFAQRLREGVALGGAMQYAGFWWRFLAILIDGVVLTGAYLVMSLLLGMVLPFTRLVPSPGAEPSAVTVAPMLIVTLVMLLLQIAVAAAYEVFFIARYGATPGKMALRLRVVRSDGSKVTAGRSFGRYFSKILSAIVLYIGFIMAGLDRQKRALHDHICDTRVVKAGGGL